MFILGIVTLEQYSAYLSETSFKLISYVSVCNCFAFLLLIIYILTKQFKKYSVASNNEKRFVAVLFTLIVCNAMRFTITNFYNEDGQLNKNLYGFLNYFIPNLLPPITFELYCAFKINRSIAKEAVSGSKQQQIFQENSSSFSYEKQRSVINPKQKYLKIDTKPTENNEKA